MNLGLDGRLALVTGSGRGIGRSISRALAEEGAKVAVVSRTTSDIESLMNEMGGRKKGHYGVAMDLVEEGGAKRFVEQLEKDFGYPSVVVHCIGGTLGIKGPYCSIDDLRRSFRFNVEVSFDLNNLLVPKMQEKKWGRVIHVSSIAAVRGRSNLPYGMVKASLNAYARDLGCAVAKDNVVVTSIMPGAVLTNGGYWEKVSKENPDYAQRYLSKVALGRFATVDEISGFVVFLASEHASFFAGAIIPIDGGTW